MLLCRQFGRLFRKQANLSGRAEQMRKLYGTDAAIHAAMRADKLMDQGDVEGFEMWKRSWCAQ